MGTGRKLVLLALAAGLLRAADSPDLIYRFHLANRPTKVEWTSARVGNWDVSVTVDAATCQLVCLYRLKRGSAAAHLLAPPAISVHVYSDSVSLPEKVTVDPAGLEFPAALGKLRPPRNLAYLPGRKTFAAARPLAHEELPVAARIPQPGTHNRLASLPALILPLRI